MENTCGFCAYFLKLLKLRLLHEESSGVKSFTIFVDISRTQFLASQIHTSHLITFAISSCIVMSCQGVPLVQVSTDISGTYYVSPTFWGESVHSHILCYTHPMLERSCMLKGLKKVCYLKKVQVV